MVPLIPYKILLQQRAKKEIQDLPTKIKKQVMTCIDGLAQDPTPLGALGLKGRKGAYRIRVGDYRIIYEVHVTEIVIYVIGVAHRKEVYLRLLRRH
jgi:mRNA interferase RelE/StbE